MGDATAAIVEGVRNVVRNPVVVGSTGIVMVALAPVVTVASLFGVVLSFIVVGPFLVRFTSALVVKPLLFGGVAGVADAGFDGPAALDDYIGPLRGNFVSLAGAFVLYEVAVLVVAVGTAAAVLATFAVESMLGPAAGSSGRLLGYALGSIGLFELLAFVLGGLGSLIVAALAVTFQFVDVAVVVGGADGVGALRESIRLTREDPVGVVGYSVMRVLLAGVVLLPGAVVGLFAGSVDHRLLEVGWIVVALLLPVAFAVITSAHVAYYRRRRPKADERRR